MNLTIDRAVLQQVVTFAARSLPGGNPTRPILAGLRITLADGVLWSDGFDGDAHGRAQVEFDADNFSIVVPGAMFARAIHNFTVDKLTLDIDGTRATVTCGRSRASFPLLPSTDYPELPTAVPAHADLDGERLADALLTLAPFAVNGAALNGRPDLASIAFIAKDGQLTFGATDAYAMCRIVLDWDGPDGRLLIPVDTAVTSAKTMTGWTGVGWTGDAGSGLATFHCGDQIITTRTIAGEPRDFARFFAPTEHSIVAYVDTAALIAIVKTGADYVPDKAPLQVAIDSEGEITVTAGGVSDATYQDVCEATVEGESFTFGIRPGYLLTALASVDSALVRIAPNVGQRKMIRFDPSDGVSSGPSDTRSAIVMPVVSKT